MSGCRACRPWPRPRRSRLNGGDDAVRGRPVRGGDEVGDEGCDCGVLDAVRGAHRRTPRIAVCGVWANASAGTAATVTGGLKVRGLLTRPNSQPLATFEPRSVVQAAAETWDVVGGLLSRWAARPTAIEYIQS
jgi:hypothetical protein